MANSDLLKRPAADVAAAAAVAGTAVLGGKLAHDRRTKQKEKERAFRLRAGESVPDGIRRIARGQIDNAHDDLESASGRKIGPAVHDARKSFKRLRATVRLARDGIGKDTYRAENTAFRDAGRRLSGARDAKVLIDTLDTVEKAACDELRPGATAGLRAQLEQEHDQALESMREGGATAAVLAHLDTARARVATWRFDGEGFDALEPGLRRIYRRGRKAMRAAAADPNSEHMHDWRKRVKDLWHAAQIVRPARPKLAKKLAGRLHELSDLLGDDHDLAVLRAYVERHPQLFEDRAEQQALAAVIERRRADLQRRALKLGRKLYKRSPADFTGQLLAASRK